jgi:hypothetical protein
MRAKVGSAQPRWRELHVSESMGHAWRALVHPLTWASVLVLLVNDQVLRWRWPSWITGKLGDVAWLAFAPLVVALLLAALAGTGKKVSQAEDRIIVIAIALVGGVFVVVKAVPAATVAFHIGFRAVFGWDPLLVWDPSDLLTLPALAIAWRIWSGARSRAVPQARPPARGSFRLARWRWVALGLAMVATLGNSGPPDMGILCVEMAEDRLLAGPQYEYAYTNTYESTDGGLTWSEIAPPLTQGATAACQVSEETWTVALPEGNVLYRIEPGRRVERSADGGASWTTDLELPGSEAHIAYIQLRRSPAIARPGPHSGVFDVSTGNLILAMGFDGVLVRRDAGTVSAPGVWEWAAVGDYRYERLTAMEAVTQLLRMEGLLALGVGLVTIAIWGLPLFRWPMRVATGLGATGILAALLILRPALMTGYAMLIGGVASLGLVGGSLILTIIAGIRIWRHSAPGGWREFGNVAAVAVLAAFTFFAPLALWAIGWFPMYTLAMWIAAVLVTVIWAAILSRKRKTDGIR